MARSIEKQNSTNKENLCIDTWKFVWNKLRPILPYHIAFNLIVLIYDIFIKHISFSSILNKASSFLFLPVVGFNNFEWILGSEWYIGYMLFVMLIIYPCLRVKFDYSCKYFAPIISLIIYGYLSMHYGSIMETSKMFRAFGGILLGIFTYKVVGWMTKQILNRLVSLILILYEVFVLISFILYLHFGINRTTQPIMVLILWSALVIMFSQKGMLSKYGFANNDFVYFLGKVSLPIYLIQNVIRAFTKRCIYTSIKLPINQKIIISVSTIILSGILAFCCKELLQNYMQKKKLKS